MMQKIFSIFILFFLFVAHSPAQVLSTQLDSLLKDKIFDDSDLSIVVYDLDADSMLYSHRAQKLCRPASVMKIVTVTAALSRLGTDYTLDTKLYTEVNGAGGNNIYISGSIDPLFCEDDLLRMLAVLPADMKVDTLFADCCFMDSIYWGPGWSWDDTPWEFQPYISPLMLNGGCVNVTAKPSAVGEPPHVECSPQSSFYTVVNEAVSRGVSGEKFTILRDWLDNSNVIRLRGDCNAAKSEKMNLYPSQEFFVAVMRERMIEKGMRVGVTAYKALSDSAKLVAIYRRPIKDVVAEALLESNNLCAEALSYHLGALYGVRPITQKMGPKIMSGFLDYNLQMPHSYNIADGSGLSLYTYLSADILLQTLCFAYRDEAIREVIFSSLPQSGISGTMKHRTKGSVAYKNIFAKTGTVKGVCTLAGYARSVSGRNLAFVILNTNSMSARSVRNWQDKVCNALCGY